MLRPYWKTLFLISRTVRIDVKRPALNSAGQRFRPLDALNRSQAAASRLAHTVMAIANLLRQRPEASAGLPPASRAEHVLRRRCGKDRIPKAPEHPPNAAFPRGQAALLRRTGVISKSSIYFPFQIGGRFSRSADAFPCIMGLHQLCQVYAFHFFELLREVCKVDTSQSLTG